MTGLLLRGAFYVMGALLLGQITAWELVHGQFGAFTEFGYVQLQQSFFLAAGAALLLFGTRANMPYRQLAICTAWCLIALLVRENDQPLELFLPHGSWKFIVLFPVTILAAYFWKNRAAVHEQLLDWSRSLSFGVMISGLFVLVFARLFGRSSFWQALMGDDYLRVVKNAAEEGVEMLALGLMFIAVVEFVIAARRAPVLD